MAGTPEALAGAGAVNPADDNLEEPQFSVNLGQLGTYRLLKLLGAGGMGQVFQAMHTRLEKVVALKVLHSGNLSNRDSIARFEREMQAVGRLNDPHIVRALDAGEAGGTHFLAMEYVRGIDLSQLVKRHGPLSIPDACELVRQAALGLQAAHEAGMVHRDIKPSNLMLCHAARKDAAPVVKVLDLGLALLSATQPTDRTDLTSKGSVMGTIDYMAPEQGGDSHLVDVRADIYSLGATLYKLLAGAAPYSDPKLDTAVKKLMALATRPPAPIGDRCPGVSPKLAKVIERMMERNRDERIASPDEAARSLEPFCKGHDLARLLAGAEGEVDSYKSNATAQVDRRLPMGVRLFSRRYLSIAVGIVIVVAGLLLKAAFDWMAVPDTRFPDSKNASAAVVAATAQSDATNGEETADDSDGSVDLLGAVSLPADVISGDWQREGTVVECLDGMNYPRFSSRHLPPEQYELSAVVERISGDDAIEFGLVIAGRPVRLILDGFLPRLCGLELIDGLESNRNETTFSQAVLTNGQASSVAVTVRRKSIHVVVDDREIIDWKGDPARFSAAHYYALPDPQPLWIGTPNVPVRIHSWKLQPLDN
jgi:serine/threonine protein kinase